MSKKIYMKDLKFPLVEVLNQAPKENLAKQKLLNGVIKLKVNECNSIEVSDKVYLCHTVISLQPDMAQSYIDKVDLYTLLRQCEFVEQEAGYVYRFEGEVCRGLKCIIIDNTIVCVFGLYSFYFYYDCSCRSYKDTIRFRLAMDGVDDVAVVFSKKNFSFTVKECR